MEKEKVYIIAVVMFLFGIAAGLPLSHGSNIVNASSPYYAEASYHNHAGATLSFVEDVHYNLSFDTVGELNGFICDDNENLTCNNSGVYLVNFQASGSGQNNHVYFLCVGINGVCQNSTGLHKKMAAGGDVTVMSGTGILTLVAGDKVSLLIVDSTGNGNGVYYGSNLNLVRIGD